MPGALAECVVRSHLCTEPCWSCAIQPAMHLLWRKTQSRGRNSSGTRGWRCMNPDCQRSFVIDRSFRGGIITHAVEEAGLSSAGVHRWQDNSRGVRRSRYLDERRHNWYQKMLAVRKRIDHNCPCGKKLRHRGSCRFRQEYPMAKDKAPDENRTADCTIDGGERTEKAPAG